MDCQWDDVSGADTEMDRCKSDCEMEMNESVQCILFVGSTDKGRCKDVRSSFARVDKNVTRRDHL